MFFVASPQVLKFEFHCFFGMRQNNKYAYYIVSSEVIQHEDILV